MKYTSKFGDKLQELRQEKYSNHRNEFSYCKNQETFGREVGYERYTVTNWERNKTSPNLETFIKICNLLDCTPDYLLSVSDTVTNSKDIAFISKELNLSVNAVEKIKYNEFLAKFINHMLESNNFEDIINEIQRYTLTQWLSTEIFQTSFNDIFIKKIEHIFSLFLAETYPLERSEEKYQLYLTKKISFETIKARYGTINEYLKANVSQDTFHQISLNYESCDVKTEEKLYEIFIEDLASRTYDILLEKHHQKTELNKITQTFATIIENYKYR